MIPLYPTQLLAPKTNWLNNDSTPNYPFFNFCRSLFLRTGGASGVPLTAGANLVAHAGGQSGALTLTNDFNEVTTGTGGVSLAKLQPGQFQVVLNQVAGNLNVYPAAGGQIFGLAVNAPSVLGTNSSQLFWCSGLSSSGAPIYQSFSGSGGGGGGVGTVTSVAETVPAQFTIAGSPVTNAGTLAISNGVYWPNVVDFGADPTGAADSAAAIQSAINSLPASGGIVTFPAGIFKIGTSLQIGNGTASAISTKSGVVLQGSNVPGTGSAVFPFTANTGTRLNWSGGGNPMITILGPLSGWGVQNMYLDGGGGTASTGINPISAQNGDCRNLTIAGCIQGIGSTAHPLGGYVGINDVDSWQNTWINTTVITPNVANAFGIVLTGASDGTADTDYNVFVGTTVLVPAPHVAINLQVCDGNTFFSTRIVSTSGNPTGIEYDYSVKAGFPNGNIFYGIDTEGRGVINNGSPSGSSPNFIIGLEYQNGGTLPNLANLVVLGIDNRVGSLGIAGGSGFGGTVTQITNTSTPVTINNICGQITLVNAARVINTPVIFTVNNTTVAATDTIIVHQASAGGGTPGGYLTFIGAVTANAFSIVVDPFVSETAAPVLNFQVIKAVIT